jgi:uncharacterized NAD(P)/FAD-binding protein YdhS
MPILIFHIHYFLNQMPHSAKTPEIAIVGAGFCGLMTAYHLVKEASSPLSIHIINPSDTFGRGAAYSTHSLRHLLNVPAAKMSALHDDPHHFLNWIHQLPQYNAVNKELLGKTFLPRKLYGDYFNHLWAEALKSKRADTSVSIIHDIVTDIEKKDYGYQLQLKAHDPIAADYVVLATGHETPSNPPIGNEAYYQSKSYIQNPWHTDVAAHIKPGQNVLIIGNGLTTVDTIISIMDSGFKGQIHTLSPSGFAILPHRHNHLEYREFVNELNKPYSLSDIHTKFMKHYTLLREVGISVEPIADSLRPISHQIWKALSEEEKKTFLNEIRTPWGKVRHRLAPQIYDYLQNLRLKGNLVVHAAKLIDIQEGTDDITVQYLPINGHIEILHAGVVINCTGPLMDIARSENPLLLSLMAKGLIKPDSLRIGMDVTDSWTLIDANGKENSGLYTLGGNLRGLLWETIAIPELKVQTAELAKRILGRVAE